MEEGSAGSQTGRQVWLCLCKGLLAFHTCVRAHRGLVCSSSSFNCLAPCFSSWVFAFVLTDLGLFLAHFFFKAWKTDHEKLYYFLRRIDLPYESFEVYAQIPISCSCSFFSF